MKNPFKSKKLNKLQNLLVEALKEEKKLQPKKSLKKKLDKYLNNRTTKFRFGEDVTTSILKRTG